MNASPNRLTASTSAMVGLTYWMKPSAVMEMRLAAAEYKSSGMAVSKPHPTKSPRASAGDVTARASGVAGVSCHNHGATAPTASASAPSTPVSTDSNAMPGSAG